MKRLVSLDILRALAIILVLGHHPPGGAIDPAAHGYGFFVLWHRVGWVGVDLFFVLSGFLIGGLLFAELQRNAGIDAKRFYVRRAFKIWPPYFAFLAVTAFLAFHDQQATPRQIWSDFWPNLVHVQNYVGVSPARWHTWSLAVEEHFYLILPLLLLFLVRVGTAKTPISVHSFPLLFAFIAVMCLMMRITNQNMTHEGFVATIHHGPTHLRFDSLMAGVALSYAVAFRPDIIKVIRRWRWALPFVAGACFTPALLAELNAWPFLWTYGFTLLWLGSACIVLFMWFAEDSVLIRSLPARGLALIGLTSYSIYVWHMPLGHRIAIRLCHGLDVPRSWQFPLLMAVYLAVALGLGWLLMQAIERPALALRDKLVNRTERANIKPIPAMEVTLAPKEA